jgi:hypothetical protein
MQGKVLALIPAAPKSVTTTALATAIEKQWSMPKGEMVRVVQSQLRELQLRQLVRAVRREGEAQLGWCRP